MKKTVIELFAGVGGFRVGLNNVKFVDGKVVESGEWDFVWSNQWEPGTKTQHAFDCYTTRFGKLEHHSNEDINLVNKDEIPDHNILVGGFPCQDYSVARTLKNEKGIEGRKGVLFWDIMDTIKAKKPAFILLENVDRLLKSPSKQRGRDFGIMLRSLDDEGYNIEWRVINAADYGFAQRRRRVYIFAWSKKTDYNKKIILHKLNEVIHKHGLNANSFPILEIPLKENSIDLSKKSFHDTVEMTSKLSFNFYNAGVCINGEVLTQEVEEITNKSKTLKEIIEKENIDERYFLSDKTIEKFNYLKGSKKIERKRTDGGTYFFSEGGMQFPDSLDKPGRTMLTSEGTTNRSTHVVTDINTGRLRLITPIEAERLQGFPDDWTNTGMPLNRRYFMMGNALVTNVINKYESSLNRIFNSEISSV